MSTTNTALKTQDEAQTRKKHDVIMHEKEKGNTYIHTHNTHLMSF
jgi:hypothetical protein